MLVQLIAALPQDSYVIDASIIEVDTDCAARAKLVEIVATGVGIGVVRCELLTEGMGACIATECVELAIMIGTARGSARQPVLAS